MKRRDLNEKILRLASEKSSVYTFETGDESGRANFAQRFSFDTTFSGAEIISESSKSATRTRRDFDRRKIRRLIDNPSLTDRSGKLRCRKLVPRRFG